MKASIIFLAVLAATTATAQAPVCDSSALRTPIGQQVDTLRVFLRRADLSSPLPSTWAISALEGIRQTYAFPKAMGFSAYVAGYQRGTAIVTARASLLFDARRDGTVRIQGMLAKSGSDALDASLAAALRAAGEQRAFAPFPDGAGRELRLVAELDFGTGDSLRAGLDVASLELPVYRDFSTAVASQPSPDGAQGRPPVQMIAMVDAEGRVMRGHADFASVRDVGSASQLLDLLGTVRVAPARIAGCAVPTLITIALVPPPR